MADGAPPPWPTLIPALARVLGVETVVALEDVEIVPREQVIGGTTVTVFVERRSRRIRVTYNRLNVKAEVLADRIRAAGVQVEAPVHIGQLGQQIVIPPAPIR
jgi:hypothetical protein